MCEDFLIHRRLTAVVGARQIVVAYAELRIQLYTRSHGFCPFYVVASTELSILTIG